MTKLDLPPLYEVITLDRVDNIAAEAAHRAAQGANEGTLIWAHVQDNGRGRQSTIWESPPDGLYAALILRPECPRGQAGELAMVAAVSLGEAIADHVVPLTDLRYRWPNDLLISQAKAAAVNLIADNDHAEPAWVALVLQVNVATAPASLGLDAASLHGDGGSLATPAELLESFGRAFLSWVNRWADEGPAPIMRAWRLRADGAGAALGVRLDGRVLEGRIEAYEDDGSVRLTGDDGQIHHIGLSRAFRLEKVRE